MQLLELATEPEPVENAPGRWDAMISYTQRHPTSEALAYKVSAALQARGQTVWLDVEMGSRDEAAMEEGVKNSACVITIVSGPHDGEAETAYFRCPFCLKELRWAKEAGVTIQPVVAVEDMAQISEMFAEIPADLQELKALNWEHLDRKDADYWSLGMTKVLRAAGIEPEPEPEPDPEPELEPEPGAYGVVELAKAYGVVSGLASVARFA